MSKAKQANIDFFKSKLKQLLADKLFANKFVIIHNSEIQGVFDSFEAAITEAANRYPADEFVVQEVVDESQNVNYLFVAS
jgi:hypothetical protein